MKVALIISIFVLTPFIVITAFRKSKFAKNVGTVIMAFAVGILLSFLITSGFLSGSEKASLTSLQDLLMNICAPLAIPLMLFSSNFRLWTQSLPKTIIALITGVVAVVVAVIVSFFIFRGAAVEELNNLAAMMTGFYTGGNINFFAISKALNTNETVTTIAYISEMIIVLPFILFITAGGYRLLRWLLPFKDEMHHENKNTPNEIVLSDVENYDGIFTKKVFPKMMLGFLLSVSFFAIGAGLSLLITNELNVLVIILTITTLAIIASFNDKIRKLPRTFELGMFFILIFSVVVSSLFDISKLTSEAANIFLFVLFITLISITLHIILCRIFKVSGDLFAVAIIGLICSPPFVPPIVGALGNRKVLISGITIGLAGYAIGTYLGLGVFYLLKLF